jgi:hypothetical protein
MGMSGDTRGPTWAGFCLWAIVGAAVALGAVSFIEPLLVLPVILLVALIAFRVAILDVLPGLVSGAGLLSLFVAWVQRAGPSTTCWQSGTTSGCDEHLDPLPWLVVGLALVVGACVLQAWRIHRRRTADAAHVGVT